MWCTLEDCNPNQKGGITFIVLHPYREQISPKINDMAR